MLMYLAINSCPDIDFAVHQYAHYTYALPQYHDKANKPILYYNKCKEGKGLIIQPYQNLQVACYVDADPYGIWGVE